MNQNDDDILVLRCGAQLSFCCLYMTPTTACKQSSIIVFGVIVIIILGG